MPDSDLGTYLIVAFMAMAISMAIIPLMMRLAPKIGMIDIPDSRKVHEAPIPRVGGVGIVVGLLIPLLIWLPLTDLNISFLVGAVVLLVFGVWDDIKELGHYVKFIGQFTAAITVVYFGDLYVQHFPFIGFDILDESIGRPFTVIAIVGMINAINHSDGLDGLAGGESLLSFCALAYLAYLFDGHVLMIIAAATIGGIFGFLRFNSHPARVFMGDGGSQVLGFTLAVLVVLFTQKVNPVVSPAIPVLLLGLPIVDILVVFYLRGRHRMNLFKATKNHIHHRFLDLGFYHYESVVIIYSIQAFLVVCAVLLYYETDILIMSVYLVVSAILFALLTFAEKIGWKIERNKPAIIFKLLGKYDSLLKISSNVLEIGVILFILGCAFFSTTVPTDIGVASLLLIGLLVFVPLLKQYGTFTYRLVMFVAIGFCVYLISIHPPEWLLEQEFISYIYYIAMSMAVFITARLMLRDNFQITPLDYLVIIMALVFGAFQETSFVSPGIMWIAIKMIVLFYSCELVIQNLGRKQYRLTAATVIALSLIAFRSLL